MYTKLAGFSLNLSLRIQSPMSPISFSAPNLYLLPILVHYPAPGFRRSDNSVEYNPCVASLRREPFILDSTRLQATFSLAQASSPFTFSVCSGQRTQGAKIEFVVIRGNSWLESEPGPTSTQQELKVLDAGCECAV
jgi:hypothetical protein